MLFHCDLVYLGENSKLMLPFVNLGLCPEAGSSYLLTRLAGYPKAAEMLMLGEEFSAQFAVDNGIANEVVEGNAFPRAMERAQQLAKQPAASVRLAKQFMRGAIRETTAQVLADEGVSFMQRLGSPEAMEAMTAFLEKREPDFSQFD